LAGRVPYRKVTERKCACNFPATGKSRPHPVTPIRDHYNKQHVIALKHPAFIEEDMGGKTGNKAGYFDKLKGLLEDYSSLFIVSVDNVSSQQMHEIRQSLRGEGVVLMGKNTMVSKFADLLQCWRNC
jgi:hypothetical protein